jgi:hypothetical protein
MAEIKEKLSYLQAPQKHRSRYNRTSLLTMTYRYNRTSRYLLVNEHLDNIPTLINEHRSSTSVWFMDPLLNSGSEAGQLEPEPFTASSQLYRCPALPTPASSSAICSSPLHAPPASHHRYAVVQASQHHYAAVQHHPFSRLAEGCSAALAAHRSATCW